MVAPPPLPPDSHQDPPLVKKNQGEKHDHHVEKVLGRRKDRRQNRISHNRPPAVGPEKSGGGEAPLAQEAHDHRKLEDQAKDKKESGFEGNGPVDRHEWFEPFAEPEVNQEGERGGKGHVKGKGHTGQKEECSPAHPKKKSASFRPVEPRRDERPNLKEKSWKGKDKSSGKRSLEGHPKRLGRGRKDKGSSGNFSEKGDRLLGKGEADQKSQPQPDKHAQDSSPKFDEMSHEREGVFNQGIVSSLAFGGGERRLSPLLMALGKGIPPRRRRRRCSSNGKGGIGHQGLPNTPQFLENRKKHPSQGNRCPSNTFCHNRPVGRLDEKQEKQGDKQKIRQADAKHL